MDDKNMEEERDEEYDEEREDEEQEEEEQEEEERDDEEQEEEEWDPISVPDYEKEPIKMPEIDYSKMFKEVKVLNNIKTFITYINSDNEIEIINQKKIYLNNHDNIVTRNQLIEVIKNSQKKHNVRYKLISIMVYNIHVTPESLPNYIENPNDFISLYTLNRIESFELQPTLRLLKKYNGIYFFFFECPDQSVDPKTPISNNTSIVDSNHFIKNKNNNTRRIHINTVQKQKKQNHKKTKRYDRYVNLL
jgi:cobalamin biosynthesis protein CobT